MRISERIDIGSDKVVFVGDPAGFSWSPCGSCGSSLGGDRFEASVHDAQSRACVDNIEICVDCAAWFANGDDVEVD